MQLIPRIGFGPFYFTDVRDTLTLIVLIFLSLVMIFFKAAFTLPGFKFDKSGLYNFFMVYFNRLKNLVVFKFAFKDPGGIYSPYLFPA